jgi:hypothetical protein
LQIAALVVVIIKLVSHGTTPSPLPEPIIREVAQKDVAKDDATK